MDAGAEESMAAGVSGQCPTASRCAFVDVAVSAQHAAWQKYNFLHSCIYFFVRLALELSCIVDVLLLFSLSSFLFFMSLLGYSCIRMIHELNELGMGMDELGLVSASRAGACYCFALYTFGVFADGIFGV